MSTSLLTRKLLHLDQGVLGGCAFQELLSQPAATCFQEPENRAPTMKSSCQKKNRTRNQKTLLI